MKKTLQKITSLPENGAISGISGDMGAGKLWLCSPAGLFFEQDGIFRQQVGSIPFRSASAVLAIDKMIIAAAYPNHVINSADGGQTWFRSRVEQVSSVITCFAASPNLSKDGTLLAGTDGDGILRSTDRGNSWQLSNFGLRSLNILNLACAPAWDREVAPSSIIYNYEVVFAATEQGVYMSPNAGRAWKFAGDGLPSVPVLSIAVSPDFKRSATSSTAVYKGAVFAGTEGAGLYRSYHGGHGWQVLASLPTDMTINSMSFDAHGTLFLGTGEHGILASPDLGETWDSVLETEDSILCLVAQGTRLIAGTAGSGLLAFD